MAGIAHASRMNRGRSTTGNRAIFRGTRGRITQAVASRQKISREAP